jgi:hypothetical protein
LRCCAGAPLLAAFARSGIQSDIALKLLGVFEQLHPEEVRNAPRSRKPVSLVKANRSLERFRRIQCHEPASSTSQFSLSRFKKRRRHSASLPLRQYSHSAQMSLLAARFTSDRANYRFLRNRDEDTRFANSFLKRERIQHSIGKSFFRLLVTERREGGCKASQDHFAIIPSGFSYQKGIHL